MLAIAIHSQVIIFPFFGQVPTDRDNLMNGVTTSSQESWSLGHSSVVRVKYTSACKTCLKSIFCQIKQGMKPNTFISSVYPSTSRTNQVDSNQNSFGLILSLLADVFDKEAFKKFLV